MSATNRWWRDYSDSAWICDLPLIEVYQLPAEPARSNER